MEQKQESRTLRECLWYGVIYSIFHLTANNSKITPPVKIPAILYISFEHMPHYSKLCLQVLVCGGHLNLSQTTVH